jgi:hypothetical protein
MATKETTLSLKSVPVENKRKNQAHAKEHVQILRVVSLINEK